MKIFLNIIKKSASAILLFSMLSVAIAQDESELILMSEQFPPYNYIENGVTKGISVDVVEMILMKTGSQQTRKDIKILPWARSYRDLTIKKNTVLFVVTKTIERSPLFKWVGPLTLAKNVLVSLKNFDEKITRENIHKYNVGVVQDDAGEQLMLSKFGLKKEDLNIVPSAKINIRKLKRGRIDLFAYDENVARWLINREGFNNADFKTTTIIDKSYHFIAFNKQTSDETILKWQKALDQLQRNGTIDEIISKYLDSPQ